MGLSGLSFAYLPLSLTSFCIPQPLHICLIIQYKAAHIFLKGLLVQNFLILFSVMFHLNLYFL